MTFMLPMATRDEPVRWDLLLRGALSYVGLTPEAAVVASLNALSSYASSPPTLYSNLATGLREAKAYSGLLLSLDAVISSWPPALLENVVPPPVRVGEHLIPVSGPAMEAIIVLYNAAISNCEEGNAAMARVHADDVRARTFHATDAGTTTGVVLTSSPNMNSKAAYKSFGAALELVACAEHALIVDLDRLLSPSDRHTLQRHLDFRMVREFAELCMAVAKYTYSITSGTVAKRHDTLAKLAHKASIMAVPAGLASSELLRLLPTLLLAAYHRHKAEHYKLAAKVPDMSLVLGHIAYSWRLVNDLQQHHMEAIVSQWGKSGERQSGGWQLLGRLSATFMGVSGSNSNNKKCDTDVSEEKFGKLLSALEETDLVKIFPLVRNLLHDIPKLYDKYHHDNAVVYYARPARLEDVIADTPEAEPLGTTDREATVPPTMKLHIDPTSFSDLPSIEALREVVEKRQVTHELQDDVEMKLGAVQKLVCSLKDALQLPSSVEGELARLEPLLLRNRGAAAVSLDTCIEEAYKAVSAALQRHECVSDELYRAKSEYIGEYVCSFENTASLKQRGRAWRERVNAIRVAVSRDLQHRDEAPTLRESLLLPEKPIVYACLTLAERVLEKSKRALALIKSSTAVANTATISPSKLSAVLAELLNVEEIGATAADRAKSLCCASRWDRVCHVLSEVRTVLVEADNFIQAVEEETKLLEREKSRIVLTPLTRLHDVCFDVDEQVGKKRQRRVATPSPKTGANRRRLEALHLSGGADEDEIDDHQQKEVRGRRRRRSASGERDESKGQVTAGLIASAAVAGHWEKAVPLSESDEEPSVPKATIAPSLLQRIKQRGGEVEKQEAEEEGCGQTRQRRRRAR